LPLARKAGRNAESRKLDRSGRTVHQDIGRLDVLVDEAALVELAHRHSDADRKMQKASHVHRRGWPQVERLAAGILKHQCGPTAFADELERSCCPCPV
jgi:hypothetical protein